MIMPRSYTEDNIMAKKIYILAPNDRFNYGDLIFPYILRHYLSDITDDIVFCSSTESDLSSLGGIKTESFKVLYDMDKEHENYIIVAGGESLLVSWWPILSYVSKKADRIQFQINRIYYHLKPICHINDGFRNRCIDWFLKPIFKFKTKYPFSIRKDEIHNLNGLYYNSVGNVYLSGNPKNLTKENKQLLDSADYISVRDEKTSTFLNNLGVNHKIVPDTAILMSELFSESYLYSKLRPDFQETFKSKDYVFFQINHITWSKDKSVIIEQLSSILESTGISICLCPIGTAMGHQDDIALSQIYEICKSDKVHLVSQPTLWEIMWLIKNARLYIGTSLHGVITSLSYKTPYISHSVPKVEEYLKQWTDDVKSHFCSVGDISTLALRYISRLGTSSNDVEKQKKLARLSIKTIHDMIQNG